MTAYICAKDPSLPVRIRTLARDRPCVPAHCMPQSPNKATAIAAFPTLSCIINLLYETPQASRKYWTIWYPKIAISSRVEPAKRRAGAGALPALC